MGVWRRSRRASADRENGFQELSPLWAQGPRAVRPSSPPRDGEAQLLVEHEALSQLVWVSDGLREVWS